MILYHFDLYPRDDPRDGALLVRFTKLQSAEYRGEANGTGAGRFSLRADTADAGFIDPAGLQYVRVVREDTVAVTEAVVGGFFLDSGDFTALDDNGTRLLVFGGAGTLSYLARSVMAPHTYISPIFTGQDPFDDIWRLYAQSTAYANGNYLGAMLWRVIYEAQHFTPGSHRHVDGITVTDTHADDRTESALPALTMGFDQFDDSSAAAWTASSGEFKAQIGENVLRVVKRFMEAGLYVSMDPDTFELDAWQAAGHGRTRTGGAWGASVIRFQAPSAGTVDTGNIKSDAKRGIAAFVKRSLLWAGGSDVYAKSTTGGSDIPWEGFYPNDAADATDLAAIATVQLGARSDAGDTLRLRMKLDASPTTGKYLPFESAGVLLDDTVTVHTGTGQWDWNEDTFPVAALTVQLRQGGDWDAWAELGSIYSSMAERAFQVSDIGPHSHLQLCDPAQPGSAASCALDPSLMTAVSTPNGGFETGLTTDWTINQLSGGVAGPGAGAWEGSYYYAINGAGYIFYQGWTGFTFIAGQTYVVRWRHALAACQTRFGLADETDMTTQAASSGGTWVTDCIEWTPDNNADAADVFFAMVSTPGLDSFQLDDVRLYTGGAGSNPLHGTSKYAARCDHTEHEILARDPTVNDDETTGYPRRTIWHNSSSGATFISTDGTEGAAVWVEIGGGGAPTDATYLVTAAHADLSAEVVVGATPGGELGGTWAAPTVDATHSGSTHSAATDTHIADASDAHDASAISFTPNGSIAATDVQAAIQEVRDEASGSGIPATIFDAKGDLIAASAADTAARLAAAANGASLITASGEATGLKWRLNNDGAAAAPAVTDDSGDGYSIGSHWIDTTADKEYVALDVTVGAAVWKETTASPTGGTIEVEDEGTPLATSADTLDFVGAGVTATGAGTTKTITIPGGSGGGSYTIGDWSGATQVTPTGSAIWTPGTDQISGRDVLSVKFNAVAVSDAAVNLKAIGGSSPRRIQTAFRMLGRDVNYMMAGLCFTDGVTAGSKIIWGMRSHSTTTPAGALYIYRNGTITAFDSAFTEYAATLAHVTVSVLHMRLTWVSANTWRLELSPDAVSWTTFGVADPSSTMTPTHVGFGVTNYSASTVDRIVTFEYFIDEAG